MSDTGGSDSFSETTHTSWGSRIGESIKGILFGLVLIPASVVLLFWNEGRAVQTHRSLMEGAGLVVDVDTGKVDPANEGKLVHVSGEIKTTAALNDPEFGVSAAGVHLVRVVEMYQWKEETSTETRKNAGGSEDTVTTYSYVNTWAESRIDSSKFRRPDGHANPQMRYSRYEAVASDAKLGAFRPGERVLRMLPANDQVRVDPEVATRVAQRLRGPAQSVDGRLYIGADPANPRIGDLRISYQLVKAGLASVIGRQAGSDFADYQTQAGDRLLMARPGVVSAADMFKAAEQENRILTWILRVVGSLVMFAGFALILRPLVVVADVIPLIGNVLGAGAGIVSLLLTAVLAPIVIAVAWFWYRPLVSVAVLVVGFAIAYGLKVLAGRRNAARIVAAPAAAR